MDAAVGQQQSQPTYLKDQQQLYEPKPQPQPQSSTNQQPTSSASIFYSYKNMIIYGAILLLIIVVIYIIVYQYRQGYSDDDDSFIVKPVRSDTSADFDVHSMVAKINAKQEAYIQDKKNTT